MADLQKRGGLAAIAGALLAIAGNAVVVAATPSSWARSSSRSRRR
jgi:hypothetical protein